MPTGQLGDNSTTTSATPVQMTGVAGASKVAGGSSHSLVSKTDGTVMVHRLQRLGRAGPRLGQRPGSAPPPRRSAVFRTSIGDRRRRMRYSVALKSDGTVWTWGTNHSFSSARAGHQRPQLRPGRRHDHRRRTARRHGPASCHHGLDHGCGADLGPNGANGLLGDGTTTSAEAAARHQRSGVPLEGRDADVLGLRRRHSTIRPTRL